MFDYLHRAESSKETGNPQQAHKGRLFMHVSAVISRRHCSTDCCGVGSHQVLVIGVIKNVKCGVSASLRLKGCDCSHVFYLLSLHSVLERNEDNAGCFSRTQSSSVLGFC